MYSDKSYLLTEEEYNYLLPVLRKKLLNKGEINKYYFIGNADDLSDMLLRLKGLYDYFDDYNKIIDYKCFKNASIQEFRNTLKI